LASVEKETKEAKKKTTTSPEAKGEKGEERVP
jgi:hypothetical protein